MQGRLGGGEGIEGLYGSVMGKDLGKIFESMRRSCGLGPKSHIIDIGAGLGRPLVHALLIDEVANASGIEIDTIKCRKAEAFMKQSLSLVKKKVGYASKDVDKVDIPKIINLPMEKIDTLDPATHAYSFWEGVPVTARIRFGQLFSTSKTLHTVAVVQRCMSHSRESHTPADVMEQSFCFGPLEEVDSFPVKMGGSGRSFRAYIFRKASTKSREHSVRDANNKCVSISASLTSEAINDDGCINSLETPLRCDERAVKSESGLDDPYTTSAEADTLTSHWTQLPDKRVRKPNISIYNENNPLSNSKASPEYKKIIAGAKGGYDNKKQIVKSKIVRNAISPKKTVQGKCGTRKSPRSNSNSNSEPNSATKDAFELKPKSKIEGKALRPRALNFSHNATSSKTKTATSHGGYGLRPRARKNYANVNKST